MCLAVPAKVLRIDGEDALSRTALVSFGPVQKTVSLACVPETRLNDYVLVHAGLAISIIDDNQAQQVFAQLDEMGQMESSS